jgi:putative flippase GtrA
MPNIVWLLFNINFEGAVLMGGTFFKLNRFLHDKDSVVGQIVKYVLCGGTAVVVDFMTFYALAILVFPCLRASDPVARILAGIGWSVQEVSVAELERNFWIIKGICFIASNAVVYILNVLFVFKSGRHRKAVEILLFFGSSLFQFFFIWVGGVLITEFNWEVTYSNVTMLLVSMMVNYVVRKKLVFKG